MMIAQKTRGFTLIETMVAIAIISIAIIGPMYAIQQGLTNSYGARDKLIASGLAQDGLEAVRSLRDGNYLYNIANPGSPRSWFFGLDGTGGATDCRTPNSCVLDAYNYTVSLCSGTCPVLKLSSGGTYNVYNQATPSGTNIPTKFTRSLSITSVNAHEMSVSVTVSWITSKIPKSITVTENLQDWL